jgi:hypothetical protein
LGARRERGEERKRKKEKQQLKGFGLWAVNLLTLF